MRCSLFLKSEGVRVFAQIFECPVKDAPHLFLQFVHRFFVIWKHRPTNVNGLANLLINLARTEYFAHFFLQFRDRLRQTSP